MTMSLCTHTLVRALAGYGVPPPEEVAQVGGRAGRLSQDAGRQRRVAIDPAHVLGRGAEATEGAYVHERLGVEVHTRLGFTRGRDGWRTRNTMSCTPAALAHKVLKGRFYRGKAAQLLSAPLSLCRWVREEPNSGTHYYGIVQYTHTLTTTRTLSLNLLSVVSRLV